MGRIFISYRREDSDIWVGRLSDELRKHFPAEQVFQDISSIDPGADFRTVLNDALATAGAVLVVIGPRWLPATDKQGRQRLAQASDLVRQEIVESLKRANVRVFPILVNEADMPAEDDLPEPLKPLAHRQAFELTAKHWANDVSHLMETLKRAPGLIDAHKSGSDAAYKAKEEAKRRAADEQARKRLEEKTRKAAETATRRRHDEEVRQRAAEQRHALSAAGAPAPQQPRRRIWKFWAIVGGALAALLAVELVVASWLNQPRDGRPAPAASSSTSER